MIAPEIRTLQALKSQSISALKAPEVALSATLGALVGKAAVLSVPGQGGTARAHPRRSLFQLDASRSRLRRWSYSALTS